MKWRAFVAPNDRFAEGIATRGPFLVGVVL